MSQTDSREEIFTIGGMHCAGCASSVEEGLKKLQGVRNVRVNFAMGSAAVLFDPNTISSDDIPPAVEDLGYSARIRETGDILNYRQESVATRRSFALAALMSVPLYFVNMITGAHTFPASPTSILPYLVVSLLATAVIVFPGRAIFADAWTQTRHKSANMNSLIALGTGAAYFFSLYNLLAYLAGATRLSEHLYFESVGVIITLILFGRYLEARASGKTKESIVALLDLRPEKATALINGVQVEIESASAQPGMTLLVRPGEKIPADGEVSKGEPSIDESMLTGESIPVDKSPGSEVIGGSINGAQPFEMTVTASGESSYLSSIIRMVSEAQSSKAPVQKLADRIAGVFTPIVLSLAIVTFAVWFFFGGESGGIMAFSAPIAVLIIACPCALGLATPTAVLAGSGAAARQGVLIKGGEPLERMVKADLFSFDKTGTLTFGQPEVTAVCPADEVTEESLLRLAAALESSSEHPLADGVMREVARRGLEYQVAEDITAHAGSGMSGRLRGKTLLIGSQRALADRGVELADQIEAANCEMEKGKTVVFVAYDGAPRGFIALSDKIRPEAANVIAELRRDGIEVYMLTGDNRRAAKTTAKALGVSRFESEVNPEQKGELIRALTRIGHTVVMVGDGINDAPALAQSNVGVAVGGGTDVAKQTADIVLLKSNLNYVLLAREISRKTYRAIKQNLFWALIYNTLAIPLAAGALFPSFGLALSPKVGALAMALSSVMVVGNSARLARLHLRSIQPADEAS